MSRRALALGLVWSLIPGGIADAATLTPVLKTRKFEEYPAAAPGYLAWSQSSSRQRPFNLFVRPTGGTRFRVNPAGTQGFMGSIDGTTLAYNQATPFGDVKFFDLAIRIHSDPPPGVNTAAHESGISLSGSWLLFRRSAKAFGTFQEIILFNLTTGEQRILATGDGRRKYAQPGTVAGDFVTWLKCRNPGRCGVFRYHIPTAATVSVPNPRARAQYAAAVTADGSVYFAESTNINCGQDVGIWRYTSTGGRKRLARLPGGRDAAKMSPLVEAGKVRLFFDVFDCRQSNRPSDIFKVTV